MAQPPIAAKPAPSEPEIDLDEVLATQQAQDAISVMLDVKIKEALKGLDAANPEKAFFERLMAQMQQTSDRDTGRVTLPPEVLDAQEASRQKMGALIMARRDAIDLAKAEGRDELAEWPLYRVLDKCFLLDFIIEPYVRSETAKTTEPMLLHWDGVPNKVMLPMNAHAQAIHDAFSGSICITTASHNQRPVDIWIIGNGICVRGNAPKSGRRRIADTDGRNTDTSLLSIEDYRAKHGIVGVPSPGAAKVHVLGTIHPQANQNYTDGQTPSHRLGGGASGMR